jgi:hypothetical protein
MPKNKPKPDWEISFTISVEPQMTMDGQVTHKATALIKQGDCAYMAELELTNWSEDIAAFFEQSRPVFFDAQVNGLPDFPDMTEDKPEPSQDDLPVETEELTPDEDEAAADEPLPEAEADSDYDYEVSFYPPEDGDSSQPSLM